MYQLVANGDVPDASYFNGIMKQTVIACTSATRPGSPIEGMTIVETDTDRVMVYSGSTWRYLVGYGVTSVGTASSTITQTTTSINEVTSLTISNMTFKAGQAYRAHIRTAVYGTVGEQAFFRIRKASATGDDWGEFGRVTCEGTTLGFASMVNGSLILMRNDTTDLTTSVVLTTASRAGGTINLWASTSSPRYLIIEPIGTAAFYAGTGVEVV